MPACPSEATILAFVDGELSAAERPGLEAHLAECDECRMVVSTLARSGPRSQQSKEASQTREASRGPALLTTALAPPDAKPRTPSSRPGLIAPVSPGDVLAGKYEVERVLGVGGMGVVVAAMHRELAQRVALKFLLPAAFEAPGAQARFLREARSAARIQSEHVARVMDVGTLESGAPYIVMEYLEGVDLGEKLRKDGPLDPALAVELVLQACEAIAEAHAMGIVHRDLKPANLFLTQRADGTPFVKVLDFGISKAEGGSQGTLTTQSGFMGSPRYMSPEQLASTRDVDARTDLWALGVILFELTAGKPPFDGSSMINVCAAIATEPAPPLRKLVPAASDALQRAVAACLEKSIDARVDSIAALAGMLRRGASPEALASIERIERIGARSTPRDPRSRPPSRPGRGPRSHAPLAMLVLLAASAIAFTGAWFTRGAATAPPTGPHAVALSSVPVPVPVPEPALEAPPPVATPVGATPPSAEARIAVAPRRRGEARDAGAPQRSGAVAIEPTMPAPATSSTPTPAPALSPIDQSGLLDRK